MNSQNTGPVKKANCMNNSEWMTLLNEHEWAVQVINECKWIQEWIRDE